MSYKVTIEKLEAEFKNNILYPTVKALIDNTPFRKIGSDCFSVWTEDLAKRDNPKLNGFKEWLGEDDDFSRFYKSCSICETVLGAINDYFDDVYRDYKYKDSTKEDLKAFYEKCKEEQQELLQWAASTDVTLVIMFMPDSDHDD